MRPVDDDPKGYERPVPPVKPHEARNLLILFFILTGAASAYRIIVVHEWEHTALLFVGIPVLLGIATAFSARPSTLTGRVMKVITLALLMAGTLLGEGFVCILMAAPLFYGVGLVVVAIIKHLDREKGRGVSVGVVILLLGIPSLEGTRPELSFPRASSVTAEAVVAATPYEVAAALAARPEFDAPLPPFLQLGFPVPVAAGGSGLEPGDRRAVVFQDQMERGALVMEVRLAEPGRVVFEKVSDESKLVHWLAWEEAEVVWEAAPGGGTRVWWTLRYHRRLDPAAYFGPLERYGVGLTAAYLIETVATPR